MERLQTACVCVRILSREWNDMIPGCRPGVVTIIERLQGVCFCGRILSREWNGLIRGSVPGVVTGIKRLQIVCVRGLSREWNGQRQGCVRYIDDPDFLDKNVYPILMFYYWAKRGYPVKINLDNDIKGYLSEYIYGNKSRITKKVGSAFITKTIWKKMHE